MMTTVNIIFNAESFPHMIKNKVRVLTLTIPVQHGSESPNQSSQARKRNKSHQNWKGSSKIVSICR